jgi:hypothetical protein
MRPAREALSAPTGARSGRTMPAAAPVSIFISYSHKDEALKTALVEHFAALQRTNVIAPWHDRKITPGDEWKGTIDRHLQSAQIVLLLVSPSFIASDYCYDVEMQSALDRRQREGILVVPVILRPVVWTSTPFSQFQALPRDGRAVTEWPDQDAAFRDIVSAIGELIEERAGAAGAAVDPPDRGRTVHAVIRVRWRGPLLSAAALTFASRVFFSLALPDAPLDTGSTFVLFGLWTALAFSGWYAAAAMARRRVVSSTRRNDAESCPP